jgi:ectoine hydroxylase-related dioxygenase (phytanoyl-CoA dioxygenase family)
MQTANPQTASPSPQSVLSPDELARAQAHYAEHGYAIFPGVISKEKLADLHARIQAEFDRVKGDGKLFEGGGNLTGHLNCFPGEQSRFVYETLVDKGIIDAIHRISPNATGLPNVGLNFNMPNSVAQHYHADRPFTQEFIICNIAVVDTVIANGAIDVLPGSHKKFYPFWKFIMERVSSRTTRLSMKQGDVLIRSSNLWHRGMPNLTAAPRPMMALTWEDGGSTEPDPFKVFDGKITFRPNWYSPTLLGRLRERTFIAAPFTYDAFRFVRSLYKNKGYDN